jgi:hypothetical protein
MTDALAHIDAILTKLEALADDTREVIRRLRVKLDQMVGATLH